MGFFDEILQAKEEKEKLKAEEKEVRKCEIKPEFVPIEATIKQLFSVQQVRSYIKSYMLMNYRTYCEYITT